MADDPIDPTGVLAELSQAVDADRDMSVILDDVVGLTKRRIPGVDVVSITLVRNETAHTAATTGPLAVQLDELQYEQGYGPCLDAGRFNENQHIEDAATETRWPKYVPKARQQGLGSSLSVPLPVESYLVGALNVYSVTARAFSPTSVTLCGAFAAHVTAALSQAESAHSHRHRAAHLERALESQAVINQAKGMIMVQQKCTADVAFSMLRKLSMDQNIKLYDLAASLVTSASNHPVRRTT
jgi:GAF domain-containing protein